MSDFLSAPLEEWMESIIDYRGKTPEKTTSGIPLITAKVIKGGRIETPDEFIAPEAYDEWMRRGIPEAGDVVITTEAPLGEVAQLPKGKVALAQRVITLSGKKNAVDNTYLKYLLISRSFQEDLQARATGTTVVGIKQSVLRKIELSFPDLSRQKAIAHILGTLDDKIELNRKTNETLEAMAKVLFKSWFVDFDPVRAKAEGRPTGLPDEISELFPDSFEESELGEIPSGWTIAEVGDLVDFQNGFAFKSSDWQDDGVPVVKIGSVKPGIVDLSNVSYVSDEVAAVAGRYRLSSGDILIGMTGYVGEVGLVPLATKMPLLNQRVGKLSPLDPHLREFVYCLSRSTDFKENVEQLSHGSAQANVSSKSICGIQAPLPSTNVLGLFSATTEPILSRLLFCHRESEILSSLRDALLPRLISGELRVPDAEKMLEEVGI